MEKYKLNNWPAANQKSDQFLSSAIKFSINFAAAVLSHTHHPPQFEFSQLFFISFELAKTSSLLLQTLHGEKKKKLNYCFLSSLTIQNISVLIESEKRKSTQIQFAVFKILIDRVTQQLAQSKRIVLSLSLSILI